MVMGAGAVGSYYGALLARDGHEVTLVSRGAHLEALRAQGRVVVAEADGQLWSAPVGVAATPAEALPAGAPAPDLCVLSVKSHHTSEAARALALALAPETPVLSLQNGVSNVPRAEAALGAGRLLAAIAFVGVWVESPGLVRHGAEGWVRMGDPAGGRTPRARAAHALVAGSWDAALSDDIVHDQWHKLLWNIGFNALCAVTGASAGEALAVPASAALVREAMDEVVALARLHGVALSEEEVAGMAAPNPALRHYRPSTARDLDAGKPLERDALTGFIVAEGRRQGLPTPVNAVLDALLALQEARARA